MEEVHEAEIEEEREIELNIEEGEPLPELGCGHGDVHEGGPPDDEDELHVEEHALHNHQEDRQDDVHIVLRRYSCTRSSMMKYTCTIIR